MKDHIINDWHMIGSVDLHNEHVIALEWLHKGSKLILSHDKDTVRYSDKFQRVPVHDFRPSVVHFGGRPMDGWIAVTATGLVCVTLISPNKEVKTLYESLSAVRSKMILADVAYCNNGDLMVVTSDGLISSAVRCFKVSIKAQHGGADFTVTCQPMASFFMKTYTTNHQSCQYGKISHLRFAWKEGTNALLTCAAGNSGSCVEFWEMKEQASPVHKVFQSAGGGSGEYKSLKWKYVDTILHTSEVSAVTSSRLSPSDGALIPHYSGIVAYKDSSIKLLYRSSVTQVAAVTMENIVRLASDSGLSQSTMAGELTCMRQSTTGYIMVGVDIYSQMFVYRLSTSRDTYFQTGTLLATNHIVNLLEYCMLNGYDWFDVLLCVRPGYIDSVCDWLTDSFMKQPASIQQVYYNKYLTIKASLYRRLAYGQGKAGDCIARLLLNAVATCLHSVLRPSMLSGQEKGPVEKLTNLMRANKSEADLTSMLSLVKATETKAREYIVEPSVLQCLQQLLQWITDFTLYLLALLPTQYVHKTEHPRCGLLNDVSALHTLRELLLLIRLWGLLNPNCLPNFTATSDNLGC
ncbi:PREDICTED: mediator of RNA polymerase II transcription subunit 16-like, partial [Priapulus caudatus]|uniref:Mediator of RNA polymerase II transcription subunit 16 n=1 Tax=Priapulus caudatus TaxID=37621 RepID=A0ABM1ELR6_PRICU